MKDPIKVMAAGYRARAKKKGYKFDFTLTEFKALVTSPCVYCRKDPQTRVHTRKSRGVSLEFSANGIDRIDPNFGYTVENCVSCCSTCNIMKGAMTHEEFLEHIKLILSYFVG